MSHRLAGKGVKMSIEEIDEEIEVWWDRDWLSEAASFKALDYCLLAWWAISALKSDGPKASMYGMVVVLSTLVAADE